MADLFPSPRLDRYAQDLLQQSFAEQPLQVSPDILAQYNPNATQLQVQAPAPPPQAIQQYQGLQPSRDRQEYFNLVQQRFNEIANMVGGMDVLVKTGNMERARQAAMEDIGNIYGEPPEIQQDPRVIEIDGNRIAAGGVLKTPVILPSEPEKQQRQLAVKKAEMELTQAEKDAMDKQFERVSKLQTGLNQFDEGVRIIDQLLADPRLKEGIGANAYFALLPATDARAIAGMINQIKGQNFLNAYESLRGASGISNIEGQKAEQAMGRVDQYLKEKDLRQALQELRNRYDYARHKAQLGLQYFGVSEDQQTQPSAPQMAPSPTAPAEPERISSPGTTRVFRDPKTNRLIPQQ